MGLDSGNNVDVVETNPKPSEHLKKTAPVFPCNKSSDSFTSVEVSGKKGKEPRRRTSPSPALEDEEVRISQNHKSSESRESENSFVDQPITFPVPDFIPESNHEHVSSMMQSPPMQVMERASVGVGGYDPFRIPSAIFQKNRTTPIEWSVASNDSLFSLQLGNSFSRNRRSATKSGEVDFRFSPSPSVSVADTETRISVADSETWISVHSRPSVPTKEEQTTQTKKSGKANVVSDETTSKDETKPDDVKDTNQNKEITSADSWKSKTLDKSGEVNRPFPRPQKNKCAWSPCGNSSCRLAFCYCTCPGCYCTWPSCYCSFCSCWNCSSKSFCCFCCCHPPSILEAEGTTTPNGVAKNKPQQPPATPESTPRSEAITESASCSCFNYFSCFSWRCCSCHPCSCSSCNPFSCCTNCHPCSCSSCFPSSCIRCLCPSCCPCSYCSFNPCTSCHPRNFHPWRSCSSCFRHCQCCGSCNCCRRCC